MARSSSPTRPATSHGGDTVEDLHTWLEQVAANRMKQASKLGARALKQETLSTPSQRRARSQPTLRNSASASSSGEFFLYRGQMLPRGGWENNPLRTEVSALQHEMRSHRSAATLQHSSIERWNPLSAAASAAELRYGYRFGDAGASRRPSPSPGPPPPHASVASLRSAGGGPGSPKSRQSFAEMLSGSLFEELTPPPPPSEIPEEYHLYDMQVERKQVTLGESKGSEAYRVFPAVQPSNRSQVVHLAATLEQMLEAAGPQTKQALEAWDTCFSELVRQVQSRHISPPSPASPRIPPPPPPPARPPLRQVFVQCNDRGELLGRVRRAYQHYLAQLFEKVQRYENAEREVELRQLRREV